jgi:hypothetical protein
LFGELNFEVPMPLYGLSVGIVLVEQGWIGQRGVGRIRIGIGIGVGIRGGVVVLKCIRLCLLVLVLKSHPDSFEFFNNSVDPLPFGFVVVDFRESDIVLSHFPEID